MPVGYCKICAWSKAREFNKRMIQGWTSSQLQEWTKTHRFSFDRKTLYKHKEHAQHPADALVSYAERSAQVAVATVSRDDLFKSVMSIGMDNMLRDPQTVTVAHALKAADLQMKQQSQANDFFAILARVMMQGRREGVVEVIDGEATEIPSAQP